MCREWQNQFELHASAILGLPVNTSLKSPAASAVIYGVVDAALLVFDGVAEELAVPITALHLFAKPERFARRRMDVALVHADDDDRAPRAAKPRLA